MSLRWSLVTGALALLVAAAAPGFLGRAPYVVLSPSMTPTIDAGDVIVTEAISPTEARVGEVVTFNDPGGSAKLISHRVRALELTPTRAEFVTRGDANTGEERWSVAIDGTIGRVLYRVPKVGYFFVGARSPAARVGLIVLTGALVGGLALVRVWKPRRRARAAAGAAMVCVVALAGSVAPPGDVDAAFTSVAVSGGNVIATRPDWVAPIASAAVVGKSQGGIAGFIRQGGTYHVYSNVGDTGNPSSGVATVRANVSNLTTGQVALTVPAGAYTIAGATYGFRSANAVANAVLPAGPLTLSLTSTDAAGNATTQTGFTVIVDNTVPTATDVQTVNLAGNILGRPELGDRIVFTSSEQVDPYSVLTNWAGTSTNVVVRIGNNVAASGGNDQVTLYNATNTLQLPIGAVNLAATNYVTANATFGATGTPSTMTQSGTAITVTLGTASAGPRTTTANHSMVWTPSSTATDRAGNAASVTARTETGTADRDF